MTKGQLEQFLKYVDEETHFFTDKDVTISQVVDHYIAIKRTDKSKRAHNEISSALHELLNKPGIVRAGAAWNICKEMPYSYTTVCNVFRELILEKVRNGKAEQNKKFGTYCIVA
jgi:hypothetical protein